MSGDADAAVQRKQLSSKHGVRARDSNQIIECWCTQHLSAMASPALGCSSALTGLVCAADDSHDPRPSGMADADIMEDYINRHSPGLPQCSGCCLEGCTHLRATFASLHRHLAQAVQSGYGFTKSSHSGLVLSWYANYQPTKSVDHKFAWHVMLYRLCWYCCVAPCW